MGRRVDLSVLYWLSYLFLTHLQETLAKYIITSTNHAYNSCNTTSHHPEYCVALQLSIVDWALCPRAQGILMPSTGSLAARRVSVLYWLRVQELCLGRMCDQNGLKRIKQIPKCHQFHSPLHLSRIAYSQQRPMGSGSCQKQAVLRVRFVLWLL